MAKRGERYPYRLAFAWAHGPKGTQVLGDRDAVDLAIERLERAATHRDTTVTITVTRVAQDGARTVIHTRTIDPQEA